MPLTQFDLFSENDLLPCFGKTSLECCLPKTMRSDASWLRLLEVTFRQRPKQEDGRMRVFLSDPNASPHGESWTLNISDFHNGAEECSLSQVLLGGGIDPTKILFERKSLSGNSDTGKTQREDSAGFAESSFGAYRADHAAGTLKASGGVLGGGSETLIVK